MYSSFAKFVRQPGITNQSMQLTAAIEGIRAAVGVLTSSRVHCHRDCDDNRARANIEDLEDLGDHATRGLGASPAASSHNDAQRMQPAPGHGDLSTSSSSTHPTLIVCITSSLYVVKVINEWASLWERTGWITKTKHPVKNSNLLKALVAEVLQHEVHVRATTNEPGDVEGTRLATSFAACAASQGGRVGCRFSRTPVCVSLG